MAIYDVSTNEKKASPSLVAGGTLYADSPIGTILPYGGASAPSGWMICNGSAISRTTYSDLFAVIGTSFGVGDGSTTFNLPDMTGKTAMGVETGHALGASEDGALPNITGAFDIRSSWGTSVSDHSTVRTASGCITSTLTNPSEGSYSVGGDQHPGNLVTLDASKSSSIYTNGQTKVDPANVRVNYIIKAKMTAVPADFMSAVDEAVEEVANSFIIDVMDCNTAFEDNKCTIYRTKSQATNKPDTDVNKVFFIHSDCFTDGTNYRITQIAGTNYSVSANEAYMYIRRGLSNTGKNNITWTAWQKLVTESDVNPIINVSTVWNGTNHALNINTLLITYGLGSYMIYGQGSSGHGCLLLNVWKVISGSFAYSWQKIYSNNSPTNISGGGIVYDSPTLTLESTNMNEVNNIKRISKI